MSTGVVRPDYPSHAFSYSMYDVWQLRKDGCYYLIICPLSTFKELEVLDLDFRSFVVLLLDGFIFLPA